MTSADASGRYRVIKLAEQIGWDGNLTGWLSELTKDCPRKHYIRLAGIARGPQILQRGDNAALTLSLCRKADIVKTQWLSADINILPSV